MRSKSYLFYILWFCAVFLPAQGTAYSGFRAADRYNLLPLTEVIYITPLVTLLIAICLAAYVMGQKFVSKETRRPTERERWILAGLTGLSAILVFFGIMMGVSIVETGQNTVSRNFRDLESMIGVILAFIVASVISMLPSKAVLWYSTRTVSTLGDQDITNRFS